MSMNESGGHSLSESSSGDSNDDCGEDNSLAEKYEKIRAQNIKEREALMFAQFPDYKQKFKESLKPADSPPTKKMKMAAKVKEEILPQTLPARTCSMNKTPFKDDSDSEDFNSGKPLAKRRPSIRIKLRPIRRRRVSNRRIKFDEVTEEYIQKVEMFVGKKTRLMEGTVCHQCRQRSDDSKTICFSKECRGTRGQFCGTCLRNRYGENAQEALRNPNWNCPPCRQICNCSICRFKQGIAPTGILSPMVFEKGYSSVHQYLEEKNEHLSKTCEN